MSAIFISHSSHDNGWAADLAERLAGKGYTSLFLDFDPANGIPAGRNWEQELYRNLRSCQAVIVLCSEFSMTSDWCFAEITHAKSLGKHIFPLRIADCEVRSILRDLQVIDTTSQSAECFEPLWRGLRLAGLDPKDVFQWNAKRPPYPGLVAFREADTAVYFGRETDIHAGLDVINRLRRFGGAGLVLILGASGSGKSSLAQAGLLPRISKDKDAYLAIDPFRPLTRPFEELAIVLANAFSRFGETRDWRGLRDELHDAAQDPDTAGKFWSQLILDLQVVAMQRDATVVVTVDQFEELLGDGANKDCHRFTALLAAGLHMTCQSSQSPLLILATLRSDFLGEFQNNEFLRAARFEDISLGPLSVDAFAQVIEGPADVAGLDLEHGLVQLMVDDCSTEHALPLLAFTLRELYERYGRDGELTIEEYRDKLGGLEGSLERAAEAVSTASRPSKAQELALRKAFRSMVRINDAGQFARQPVTWSSLPESSHEILEQFVDARLLVSDTREGDQDRTIEVAHEALFRAWGKLGNWLNEDREFLLWRQRIQREAGEWQRRGQDTAVLLRGGPLSEALHWSVERGDELGSRESRFIAESRRHERTQKRLRYFIAASVVGALLLASFWVYRSGQDSLHQARAIYASSVAQLADQADDPLIGALLLGELIDLPEPVGGLKTAHRIAQAQRTLGVLGGHTGKITSIEFSPDGARLVTASEDGTARIWQADGRGQPVILRGHTGAVTHASFSKDGKRVATSGADGMARLWNIDGTEDPVLLNGHTGEVTSVAFDQSSTWVVTSSRDGTARVWRADGGTPPHVINGISSEDDLGQVLFVPGGRYLATGGEGGTVRFWDLVDLSRPVATLDHEGLGPIVSMSFSRDGSRLAVSTVSEVCVWQIDSGFIGEVIARDHHIGDRFDTALSPDGLQLLGYGAAPLAIWNLLEEPSFSMQYGEEYPTFGRHSLAISPDGHSVIYGRESFALRRAAEQHLARLWDLSAAGLSDPIDLNTRGATVSSFAFSPDGALVAAGADNGITFLWRVRHTGEPVELPGAAYEETRRNRQFRPEIHTRPVFSGDGTRLAYPVSGRTDRNRPAPMSPGQSYLRVVHADAHMAPMEVRADFGDVLALALSRNGHLLVAGSADGTARLWRLDDPTGPVILSGPPGATESPFSAEGAAERFIAEVLGSSEDDLPPQTATPEDEGDEIQVLPYNPVTSVAVHPDGNHVLLGLWDGTAETWPVSGQGPPGVRGPLDGAIVAARYSEDGSTIVLVSSGGQIEKWRSGNHGALVSRFSSGTDVSAAAVSPDATRVLTFSPDGQFLAWQTDGVELASGSAESVFAFSADLTVVASNQGDESLRLSWIAESAQPVVLPVHSTKLRSAAVSPSGDRVVTSTDDGLIHLWRSDGSGTPFVVQATAVDLPVRGPLVWFSPDGKRVLTSHFLDRTKLWRVDWRSLLAFLRSSTTACLEPGDRVRYLNEDAANARATFAECERRFGRNHRQESSH